MSENHPPRDGSHHPTAGYWSLDLVGLTEDQAVEVGRFAETLIGEGWALEIDPENWLTRSLDASSVECECAALRLLIAQDSLSSQERRCAQALLNDKETWLAERTGTRTD